MSEIRPELHLWVAYLEKKEELEEAQDRIEELETALRNARARYIELSDADAVEAMMAIINGALGDVK